MTQIEIGRLLRAGTTSFVAGCRVNQKDAPSFGALVSAPLEDGYEVYGLVYDIHIDDDGLVRQLVTADNVSPEVYRDNRERRIVPVEISVLVIGVRNNGKVFHTLPPRPPLSLDVICSCDDGDLANFTSARRFGYFRHILRATDVPIGEVLAAHLEQAKHAHGTGGDAWLERATQELITLLRDDYPTLIDVLGALNEVA